MSNPLITFNAMADQYCEATKTLFSNENVTTEMVDNYINQYWGMVRMSNPVLINMNHTIYTRLEKCFLIQMACREKYGTFPYYEKNKEFQMTNKQKVELVKRVLDDADIDVRIFCCTSCDKIRDCDNAHFCGYCDVIHCDDCASENMIEYQMCDTCMLKTCCVCKEKIYDKPRVLKCKVCKERYCGDCGKKGRKNTCKNH